MVNEDLQYPESSVAEYGSNQNDFIRNTHVFATKTGLDFYLGV